jgi:thiamine transporter 2/3
MLGYFELEVVGKAVDHKQPARRSTYVVLMNTFVMKDQLTCLIGLALQATQGLLGLAASSEVAYLTYIYANVGKEYYKKVTAYTHSAVFVGNFVSAVLAQLLVSFDISGLHGLNYFSLGGVSGAMLIAFFLPTARRSIYFNRKHSLAAVLHALEMEQGKVLSLSPPKRTFPQKVRRAGEVLVSDFKEAYSNVYVLKWSLWWAIAMAGHLQVVEYYEALWEEIAPADETHHVVYNGAVNAVQAALSKFHLNACGVKLIRLLGWIEHS